jgi:hypothetical protein
MEVVEKDIRSFQETLRSHSDYDFTEYSLSSLRRRLTKILLEYDMDMGQLTRRMGSDRPFLEQTIKKLTVQGSEYLGKDTFRASPLLDGKTPHPHLAPRLFHRPGGLFHDDGPRRPGNA